MRRKLEQKCIPQLFLGLLLETHRSAIGQFFSLFEEQSQKPLLKVSSSQFLSLSKVANFLLYNYRRHLLFNLPVFHKVPKYTLSFPCCLLKSKMKRILLWFSVHLSLARQKVASGFKILDIPLRLKKLMWWSTNKRGFVDSYEPKNLLG